MKNNKAQKSKKKKNVKIENDSLFFLLKIINVKLTQATKSLSSKPVSSVYSIQTKPTCK